MLKPIVQWIIAALLILALLYLHYSIIEMGEPDSDGAFVAIEIFSVVIMVLLLGTSLAALAALIPFKRIKYIKKFPFLVPICTSLIAILFLYSYGKVYLFYAKNGADKPIGPSKKYKDVHIPESLSCSSVHDGTFETDFLLIEREGGRQVQTYKKSKEKQEFIVKWETDCEYHLINQADTNHVLKVKIVSVYPGGYDCYAATGTLAAMYRIRKVPDKK